MSKADYSSGPDKNRFRDVAGV